ncbi:hypothetical protein C8F01DRAFT_80280 [Mycena amicta]|nr:hypothetical protein C8F01DRAFT_80280 [Mycena amicta]
MTKRSSVSGKHTPTPSIVAPSPIPSPKSDASSFQTNQPPPSPPATPPAFSNSVSLSVADTPEPVVRSQPLDTSVSTPSIDTNVSATSNAVEERETSPGRNRRSETAAVEMWPSSPSSALTRKPVNGSRLAMMQTVESEESEREERDSSDERFSSKDGGWAHVPETLPLQVVKLNSPNSIPPSPYQPMFTPSPAPDDAETRSHLDLTSATGSYSESEYDTSDAEDQDTTTKFPLPPDRRSLSPSSPRLIGTSRRSSTSSSQRPSNGADPSRSSVAAPSFHGSEDGEVGIGLSLLQGLAAADEDDSDDDDDDLVPPVGQRDQARQSAGSSARSVLLHGEDWDGGSIYDNYYRFSRFSVNPRSSGSTLASTSGPSHLKMASRLSHGSQRGGLGPSIEAVPPVPVDLRQEPGSSRHSEEKRHSADSEASVYTQASKASSVDPTRLSAQPPSRNRPASLVLVSSNGEPSPLLHTRWGSPNSSASPPSSSAAQTAFFDLASGLPSAGSSGSISPGGAASILRQRLQLERGSPAGSNYTDLEPREEEEEGLGSRIVIEDDEEPPLASIINGPVSESPDDELVADIDVGDDSLLEKPGLPPLVITDSPSPSNPLSAAPSPPSATASTSPHSPLSSAATTPISPSSPPDISSPPRRQQSQHQPKPSLSELRGYMPGETKNAPAWEQPAQRTSLFLPHPNAPKPPSPTSLQEGPMYIRAPPPPSQQRSENVINIIKMSIGRSAVTRAMPTIYGRIDGDLGSATGPVRVTFSIDPPPQTPPLPSRIPFRNGGASPAPAPPPVPIPSPAASPRRVPMQSEPDVSQPGSPATSPRTPARSPSAGPSPVPPKSSPLASSPGAAAPEARVGIIPRPNFFPKVGTSRPRSRSFSGFNTSQISSPIPISKEEPEKTPIAQKPTRSMSTIAAPVQTCVKEFSSTCTVSPLPSA